MTAGAERAAQLRPGDASAPLRVVQVVDSLGGGGVAGLLLTLAETLEPADAVEMTVAELAHRPESEQARRRLAAAGVSVVSFPGRRLTSPGRFLRLQRWLARERCHLVHTHLTYAHVLGLTAARLAGVPAVASLHTTRRSPHLRRRHLPEDWALDRLPERLIAVGPAVAAHWARYRAPTEVVPNAVAAVTPLPPEERAELRRALRLGERAEVVITVGRLVEAKAYEVLIESFAALGRRRPDATLLIAGDGPLRQRLQELVSGLGMEDRVTFLGLRRDIPALLAASELFVSSSRWEGLQLALLEALAAGLPVVATRVGDSAEAVTPACGLLVPSEDPGTLAEAMCELLSDPARRARMGAAARLRAHERFGARAWKDRLLEIYRSVVAGDLEER